MMDELTVPLKRSFSDLIFGIYGNDLKEVVDSLEEMDVIRKVSDESRNPWVSHTWWARQDLHHVCGRVAVRARVARSRTAADVLTIVLARSRHRMFFSVSEVVVLLCHACVPRFSIWSDPVVLSFPSWFAMLGGGPYDGGASNPFLPGRVPDHLDKGGEVHQRARP